MKPRFHIVPHTHWDREWYLSFQEFRWKLAHTVDEVLATLESDPAFRHFLLDGQTVVLDDVLELRPGHADRLRRQIAAGRLGVGPWYLQPDDLLASGEALIRNLEKGLAAARAWGRTQTVGHVPDSFGHPAMLPAVLTGFGLGAASLMRGPGLEAGPFFEWRAPDGSSVLVLHFVDGYGNGAELSWQVDRIGTELDLLAERQASTAIPGVPCLIMAGTDHRPIAPAIPPALASAGLADEAVVGSLEEYVDAARPRLTALPVWTGELREPGRQPLLVGVTSARSWIKAEDQRISLALERVAEPLDALAQWAADAPSQAVPLDRAWTWLLQNQPHDSLCGCSTDRVHNDMRYRYAQASDLAGLVAAEAGAAWAASLALTGNPTAVALNPGPARSVAELTVSLPQWTPGSWLEDSRGRAYTVQATAVDGGSSSLFEERFTPGQVQFALGLVHGGKIPGGVIVGARAFDEGPEIVRVELDVADVAPAAFAWDAFVAATLPRLKAPGLRQVRVLGLRAGLTQLRFRAPLPAFGAEAFTLRTTAPAPIPADAVRVRGKGWSTLLDNGLLRVAFGRDGTLSVTDGAGRTLTGVDRWEDGGDRGDEYNYDRPLGDVVVDRAHRVTLTVVEAGPVRAQVALEAVYRVPEALAADREHRSRRRMDLKVTRLVSLSSGARRVDVDALVDNGARDHRLRITVAPGARASSATAGSTFADVRRSTAARPWTAGPEEPAVTHPFTGYVVPESAASLAFVARGLREYEVSPEGRLAVTVLRCVGWLSRHDLRSRQDHAGPGIETPDAQERGLHRFRYAWVPGGVDAAAREWADLATEPSVHLAAALPARIPGGMKPGESLFTWDGDWTWDSFRAVGPGRWALRGHDRTGDPGPLVLNFARPVAAVWETRLDGTRLAALPLTEGGRRATALLAPWALQTFEITVSRDPA